jgi:hypothetical protein
MDGDHAILDDDELFLTTNVHPKRTGLPFLVSISEKGHARQNVRVKIAGTERSPNWRAIVTVRPDVSVVSGALTGAELKALAAWIDLNRDVIVAQRDGAFDDSADVIAALQPLQG